MNDKGDRTEEPQPNKEHHESADEKGDQVHGPQPWKSTR